METWVFPAWAGAIVNKLTDIISKPNSVLKLENKAIKFNNLGSLCFIKGYY